MKITWTTLIFLLSPLFAFAQFNPFNPAQPSPVAIPLPDLRTQGVSVSGLSAGGYMAVQLGVAASSVIESATVFAGGPWLCAEADASRATGLCMKDAAKIDVARLLDFAKVAEAKQQIDPVAGLRQRRFMVVHGAQDHIVNPIASQKLVEFLKTLGATTALNDQLPMGHGLPVLGGKVPCGESRSPWLNDCGFDGPALALQASFGRLRRPLREASAANVVAFDQREFGSEAAKMSNTGYIYVPVRCQDGRVPCRLHVVLHGCLQDPGVVGMELVQNAGYNRIADANDLVILYPSVSSSLRNPNGCWDWWGYTGEDYAFRSGKQIQTLLRMIDRLR